MTHRLTARSLAGLVILALALSGCGTIIHGSSQEVGISSSPTSATVTIDNSERGTTPLVADLKRKDTHTVRVHLEGYHPYEMNLTRSVSGWVWGNLVFGGIVGLAVDAITGGLYKLSPEQVQAQLAEAEGAEVVLQDERMYLFVVLQPEIEWELLGEGLDRE